MYMIEDKSANPDPGYLLSFFVRCGDPYNWTGYCNSDLDGWLSEARDAQEDAVRAKAYESIARQVTNDAPYLQLFQKDQVVITRKGITGLAFSPESEDRFYWLKRQ
jgi:ABC-type transport system substrate-binding protein